MTIDNQSITWQENTLKSILTHQCQDDLLAFRKSQLSEFVRLNFPTRHDEDWKYTDVSAIAQTQFDTSLPPVQHKYQSIDKYLLKGAVRIVFIDGFFSKVLSDCESLPKGLTFSNLANALNEQAETIQVLLQSAETISPRGFAVLNNALFQDGVFIQVADQAVIEKPIHILHLQTEHETPQMNHIRHLISVGDQSELTVLEEYVSIAQTPYFNNVRMQITAGESATVNHYRLQRESHTAFHIGHVLVDQAKSCTVNTYHVELGGKLARQDLHFQCQEAGANANLFGLYQGDQKQHLDVHTRIDHETSHCTSHQNYKGVLSDDAHAVFNGKIIVHVDAEKTNAHLDNRNLLLSKTAEVNTKPELEIYTDDVQCSHGATVGCLDENALFYLCSRGIPENKARQLLIRSFENDILDAMPNETIQTYFKSVMHDEHA